MNRNQKILTGLHEGGLLAGLDRHDLRAFTYKISASSSVKKGTQYSGIKTKKIFNSELNKPPF